jgi:hypothetical protein
MWFVKYAYNLLVANSYGALLEWRMGIGPYNLSVADIYGSLLKWRMCI